MSLPIAATILHERAQETFASRVIRGFTTFAPPNQDALISVAGTATGLLIALNAEKLARGDPALMPIANANLAYPDGAGAVLALRRLGVRAPRIAGADLWLRLVERYANDRSFYLIGATRSVIESVAAGLRARHPRIELTAHDGYLKADDLGRLYDAFAAVRPQIVFVGMGSPRQEILMSQLFAVYPALYMGVGGSFDVFAGRKPRAPRPLQRMGLEWAYQFARDPRRLRRLPAYMKFAALLAVGRLQ